MMHSSSTSYCNSCNLGRYLSENIVRSKRTRTFSFIRYNTDTNGNKSTGTSPMRINFKGIIFGLDFRNISWKMIPLFLVIASLLVSHCDGGILRGHRNRGERGNKAIIKDITKVKHNSENKYETNNGEVGPYCGTCDTRNCPLVSAETCPGQVVKDKCGCCPFCDTANVITPAPIIAPNYSDSKFIYLITFQYFHARR